MVSYLPAPVFYRDIWKVVWFWVKCLGTKHARMPSVALKRKCSSLTCHVTFTCHILVFAACLSPSTVYLVMWRDLADENCFVFETDNCIIQNLWGDVLYSRHVLFVCVEVWSIYIYEGTFRLSITASRTPVVSARSLQVFDGSATEISTPFCFEYRVFSRMFGSRTKEVAGGLEFHNLCSSSTNQGGWDGRDI